MANIFQPFVVTASMFGVTAPNIDGHLRVQRIDGPNRTTRPSPTVVLRFDDGYDSFENAVTVANAKGVPVCCAIITDTVGTSGRVTWAQQRTWVSQGHEMLCHSKTHTYDFDHWADPDDALYDEAAAIAESKGAYDAMLAEGIYAPVYVNPGHYKNRHSQALLRKYFRAAMSASFDPYICERNVNTYAINAYNTAALWNDASDYGTQMPAVKGLIDELQALYDADPGDGRMLVLYGHGCGAGDGADALAETIDYILATDDVEILTASEAMDKHAATFESGNVDDDGRGFSVAPDGSVRGNHGHFTDQVCVWNPAYPFSHHVGLCYSDADLVLFPHDPDLDSVKIDALKLLPYLPSHGSVSRNSYCGDEGWHWTEVWSKSYFVRAYYGDKLILRSKYHYRSIVSTTTNIPLALPANVKLIGIRARVSTQIEGATDWSIALIDGMDAVLGTGLSVAAGSEYFWFYNPADDSLNRVATSAETDLEVTATDATSGQVQVEAWYWQFET